MPTYFVKFDRPTHQIVVHDGTCRYGETARLMIRRAGLPTSDVNPERNQSWYKFEAANYNAATGAVTNLGPTAYPGRAGSKSWSSRFLGAADRTPKA